MLDEEEVLDWLTDPKIMSVSDGIENVNRYCTKNIEWINDPKIMMVSINIARFRDITLILPSKIRQSRNNSTL